jgi:hypothetical protein
MNALTSSHLTAIAYTADEVEQLVAYGIADTARVLAMSPIAAHAFRLHGLEPGLPRIRFTDRKFARAIGAYRRQARAIDRWLDENPLATDAFRYMMRNALRSMTTTVYRLDANLENEGRWLYICNGVPKETTERGEAFGDVFQGILARWPASLVGYVLGENPPFPKLFRLLRNILLHLMPKPDRAILVRRRDHPYGMVEALVRRGGMLYYLGGAESGWLEYLRLFREGWRAMRKKSYIQVRLVEIGETAATTLVDDYIQALTNPLIRRGFELGRSVIVTPVDRVLKCANDAELVIELLDPKLFASYEIADGHSAAVADAAGRHDIPRIIANHNTHAPCSKGVSHFMAKEVFRTLHPVSLTDIAVCWTPDSVETAEQSKNQYSQLDVYRVTRPIQVPKVCRDPSQRLILYAGNFHRWFHVSNWMFELSDEFLEGLRQFCAATEKLENVRILSRIKFRMGELHRDAVEEIVGHYPHLDLAAHSDRAFEEDLAACDLLVSYSSTTIHQALAFRRPVFLWGHSRRYRRFDAQTQPPTTANRSAVYTCLDPTDLPDLVSGVLDVHVGTDLTDAEIAPYVHGAAGAERAPSVDELAQELSIRYLVEAR